MNSERDRLDAQLSRVMDEPTRERMWSSVLNILSTGPRPERVEDNTVLALGYVQSGKTTSITALTAAAADEGYQVIVALLGSTNLLLEQNRRRLEGALGVETRGDYFWVSEVNPGTAASGKKIRKFLDMGRTILIPLLKHAGRIRAAASQLEQLPDSVKVLIIDDEADQASLNAAAGAAVESRTYAAIRGLRLAVPNHLYVQYTATPYAPLLLDTADILSPKHVEFLQPGVGYTGGREFFIDSADKVVRVVPSLDEQASRTPPIQLQRSLLQALASFVSGAALLMKTGAASPPISMLVHSTARNDVQARYEFLIRRQLDKWQRDLETRPEGFPDVISDERARLVQSGAEQVSDADFAQGVKRALRESITWLVNSVADVNKIDWHVSPVHILVGGNKLDRGFTVEGLTVTYMNRPASPQVDTLEQRARAFGYRGDLLPYCQFFASKKSIRALTDIVHTEEDLRARLRDHVDAGGTVHTWAREVGLLLPDGMSPTRANVINAVARQALGWFQLRMPSLDGKDVAHNDELLEAIGLTSASVVSQGRLGFPTLEVGANHQILERFLASWKMPLYSPGWITEHFAEALSRTLPSARRVTLMLMEDGGTPRVRRWSDGIGFVNLFQGRDLRPQADGSFYPGDRFVNDLEEVPNQVIVEVHRPQIRDAQSNIRIPTLAVYVGSGAITRKVA